MPMMKASKASIAEPSNLTEGIHAAYLLAITDEATPENFLSFEKNPRSYLWHFAVYQMAGGVGREIPEYVTAWSTQICSYGGKRASKCYEWTTTLIGRGLAVNESIDLDPLMPIACQLAIAKKDSTGTPKDFATVTGLYAWEDGKTHLQAATLHESLRLFWEGKRPAEAPPFPGRHGQAATPVAVPASPAAAPVMTDDLPF